MLDPVVRLPRLFFGPEVMTAQEMGDIVDWGLKANLIPEVWIRVGKGKDVKIAILDTGIDLEHEDLKGSVLEAKGFVPSGAVRDRAGHGTHVAGTAGGRANGLGVVGVAPEVGFLIGKVLEDDGSGASTWIEKGIRWATAQRADIISLSLGGGYHQGTADALLAAVNAGIICICAAGNDGRDGVSYPAKLSYAAAIASHGRDGLSNFSSRGPEIVATFPGENILSCWPGNKYMKLTGTSMATPFAAGLAALLLSYQKATGVIDVKNQRDFKERLKATAVDEGPPGHDNGWGWGRPDVNKFLAPPLTPPVQPGLDGALPLIFGLMAKEITYAGKTGMFIFVP